MKLAVYSPILIRNMFAEPDEAIRHVRKLGITSVEIMSTELQQKTLAEYKKFYSEYGMDVAGVIAFSAFTGCDEAKCEIERNRVKTLLEDAANNGIKRVMVVPAVENVRCRNDKLVVRDKIVSGMNEIVEYAKTTGVTVTMENYSEHTHPYSTIDEMLYLLKNVPGLKYTLDAGNFYCVREDVLKAYEVLKEYMVNLHVKDWAEDDFGYIIRPNLPALDGAVIGRGVLPIREFLTEIKKDAFEGTMLVEINLADITKESIAASVDFLRNTMERD